MAGGAAASPFQSVPSDLFAAITEGEPKTPEITLNGMGRFSGKNWLGAGIAFVSSSYPAFGANRVEFEPCGFALNYSGLSCVGSVTVDLTYSSTPEPSTVGLLALGVACLVLSRRRSCASVLAGTARIRHKQA